MLRRRARQAARQAEVAAYVRQLRRNCHGLGSADVARLSRQDGRDYSEPEVMRVMSDMHHPAFPI